MRLDILAMVVAGFGLGSLACGGSSESTGAGFDEKAVTLHGSVVSVNGRVLEPGSYYPVLAAGGQLSIRAAHVDRHAMVPARLGDAGGGRREDRDPRD